MKYLKYLIISSLTLLLFTIQTNAIVDSNSTFNVNIPDYDSNLENYSCGSENVKDFLHNFLDTTDFNSTYYDLFIGNDFTSQIVFFLIPKNNDNINNFLQYRGILNSYGISYNFRYWNDNYSNARWYYLFYKSCTTDISSSSSWNTFLTALNTGTIGSTSADSVGQLSSNSSNQIPYYGGTETLSSMIYNGSSYDTTLWFYFSSRKLQYNATNSTLNNNQLSFKNLYLVNNDTIYSIGDEIPSYYDLHNHQEPDSPGFIEYNQLDSIYTNLGVSNFSNYSLSFNFNIPFYDNGIIQSTQDFVDNMSFNYICSGRVDNTNYYSYESFPCSLSSSYSINDYNVSYTFNNLTTTQSLSNYDKLYVTLSSSFDSNLISNNISSFQYSYTLGSFLATSYKGNIFESFTSLPLNFKLYLSSNNSLPESSIYVKQYNLIDYKINYRGFSNITNNLNTIYGSSILGSLDSTGVKDFVDLTATNSIDTGIMIYQENASIPIPSLDLIFNSGIIISFNNSTNSNDFYYIDNNGNIVNNTFNKPINNSDNSKYNISYYVSIVNNFIDDLSTDSLEFANLTQSFYNGMPVFLQTFIFVVFILFCIYFTYLLIKK